MDYANPIYRERVQKFSCFKLERKVERYAYFCGKKIKEKTVQKYSWVLIISVCFIIIFLLFLVMSKHQNRIRFYKMNMHNFKIWQQAKCSPIIWWIQNDLFKYHLKKIRYLELPPPRFPIQVPSLPNLFEVNVLLWKYLHFHTHTQIYIYFVQESCLVCLSIHSAPYSTLHFYKS